jgi:hypothetical protein
MYSRNSPASSLRSSPISRKIVQKPADPRSLALRHFYLCLGSFLLIVSICTAQGHYFPPDFPAKWYEKHLVALQEPSLWAAAKTGKTHSYRFLWLRSFHHPIAVRVDINPDGTSILTTRMPDGTGGHAPGKLILNDTVRMSEEATKRFVSRVEQESFWSLPTADKNPPGEDGAQWIIEGVRNGTYHIVDRWSPKGWEVRNLGLFMVSELAKMELSAKEVY